MANHSELLKYYTALPDEKLLEIADEAIGLRHEAITVLRDELRRRGLDPSVIEQLQELSVGGIESLAEQFRQLPCPRCQSSGYMVNAFRIAVAIGFIVTTSYKEEIILGCPVCVIKAAKRARLLTLLLGWWGIPFGPIHTLEALGYNSRAISEAGQREATSELLDYVRFNFRAIQSMLN